MQTLRIATRESPLALWQAEHVKARLEAAHPGLAVSLVPMTTTGDQLLAGPLWDFDGAMGNASTREGASTDVWAHAGNRFGGAPTP